MRWSELKQDMVWSILKHMLWSVFWKSDNKKIGFSKLLTAEYALKLKLLYIAIKYIYISKRHWYMNLYFWNEKPHWQIKQWKFFIKHVCLLKNFIYVTKLSERQWLSRSCFSNEDIICQLPCGHMTISPQPWGFRVVDTVKSLFLHSLIAFIGRLSLHTIFNSLRGLKLILECKCTCEINSNCFSTGFLNID